MPVYTYHCDHCEAEFEKYQSFSEESLKSCPECGQETLRKIYSPALVVFKGSGFYVTDTKSSSATLSSNNNKDHAGQDKSDGAEKKEDKKTETKSENKAPSKEKEKK
ncbi:MAG TPA: zinc ribbon domain-containing protein [Anaerolineales bacterium]|jgi:putative FmdB family regulatory protein|nr:zinc ribbon domain-containing protein [Anaerolineales bacterium]